MATKSKSDLPKEEGTPPGAETPAKPKRDHHKKATPGEVKKSPRGHYAQKECPYCHTHVGNLGNHIKMKHAADEPPLELTKESLLTGKKEHLLKTNAPIYYCNDCHAELRKGEAACWNCHKVLNWTGL